MPLSVGAYTVDRDDSEHGIPLEKKRSDRVHDRLQSIFGSQFEGLEPGRRDLLLDVRYVDGTRITRKTRQAVVEQFHDHGIALQWLEYPIRYDRDWFESTYGWNTRDVLWGRDSFYRSDVAADLRDIAVQLVVVPGYITPDNDLTPASEGVIESQTMESLGGGMDGYVNGFSLGNRAMVANRSSQRDEHKLVLHEIAHLGLCHDDDPSNAGVMGTADEPTLQHDEWDSLRSSLDNVSDTTGYDILARPCLWEECLSGLLSNVDTR